MDKHAKDPAPADTATTREQDISALFHEVANVLELLNQRAGNDLEIEAIIRKLRGK
jgi:hypothetical protein